MLTVTISSTAYGCKMSDYILLKRDQMYIVINNKYN